MKQLAVGIIAGGAVATAFLAAAAANADWTSDYGDLSGAQVLQDTDASSVTWSLPASFTNGATTLTGDNYVTLSSSGLIDDQFVTNAGAVYDQDQLFPGITSLYYDADGAGTTAAEAFLKTPLGTFDVSWMASIFAPADLSTVVPWTAQDAATNAGLYSALNLGLAANTPTATWAPTYDFNDAQLWQDPSLSSPTWVVPSEFAYGTGTPIEGVTAFTQSAGGYDALFVSDDGAVYNQDQLGLGFTNLWYDADATDNTNAIVDMLKTPFGTWDISWLSWMFTPTDFSDAAPASPLDILGDAGLYSALDLGLVSP